MNFSEVSFKRPAVKAHTLAFAPEGWFSVKDYLSYMAENVDITLVGEGAILEVAEGRLPNKKTLSMRLLRYYRQRLLVRKRKGHKYLYRVTEKGRLRGIFLTKHYESIYEDLSLPRTKTPGLLKSNLKADEVHTATSLPTFKALPMGKNRGKTVKEILALDSRQQLLCRKCKNPLPRPKMLVCPHCHRLAI